MSSSLSGCETAHLRLGVGTEGAGCQAPGCHLLQMHPHPQGKRDAQLQCLQEFLLHCGALAEPAAHLVIL